MLLKFSSGVLRCSALACAAASGFATLPARAQIDLQAVAVRGQAVPGQPDVAFSTFSRPDINASGQLVFGSVLSGPTVTTANDNSLWTTDGTVISPVVREGDAVPGDPNAEFWFFSGFPGISDDGEVAFAATLRGFLINGSNNQSVWAQRNGGLTKIARAGEFVPGSDFFRFTTIGTAPAINRSGQVAFLGNANNAAQQIWSEGNGPLSLVASQRDPAPGATDAAFQGLTAPELNDAGHVVLRSTLNGTGVTAANNVGVWSDRNGAIELVVRKGDPAPQANGLTFNVLNFPVINNADRIAFTGRLGGPGVQDDGNSGVWAEDDSGLRLVALEGTPAPQSGGARFGDFPAENFPGTPQYTDPGLIAFETELVGPGVTVDNDGSLYLGPVDQPALIARQGQPAPGTGGLFFGPSLQFFSVNNAGQAVFQALLTGPGIDASNDGSLWAFDPVEGLMLVGREGASIDLSGDPLVQGEFPVTSIFSLNVGAINDAGQFPFVVTGGGETALLLATVPEPASAALLAIAASAATRRRRAT